MASYGEASVSPLVSTGRDSTVDPDLVDAQPNERAETDASATPAGIPFALLAMAALVVIVATATAWFVGGRGPDLYAARADLLVELGQVSDANEAERILTTQVVVIEGPGVLGPAAESLGVTERDLDAAVNASLVEGSQVIRVEATNQSGDEALRMTSAVVDQYTATPPASALDETRTFVQDELDAVTGEIERLQQRLDQARAAATPDPNTDRTLSSQIQAQTQRQSALQSELLRLELQDRETGQQARVIAPPAALEDPVAPTPERAAALGLVAGLILATAIVALGMRARTPRSQP